MTNPARPFGPAAAWRWGALALLALVVSFFVAFGMASTAASWGLGRIDDGLGLRLDLALFLVLMGVLGMFSVLIAARIAFGRWLTVTGQLLVFPVVGVVLACAVELALHEWARTSIGFYDWDFVGWTGGLSLTVLLIAVASFGAQMAPPRAALPPLVGLGPAAAIACLIVLSNLPALDDGIGPNGWPLAILVGLSALYAIGAVIIGVRRAMAG